MQNNRFSFVQKTHHIFTKTTNQLKLF